MALHAFNAAQPHNTPGAAMAERQKQAQAEQQLRQGILRLIDYAAAPLRSQIGTYDSRSKQLSDAWQNHAQTLGKTHAALNHDAQALAEAAKGNPAIVSGGALGTLAGAASGAAGAVAMPFLLTAALPFGMASQPMLAPGLIGAFPASAAIIMLLAASAPVWAPVAAATGLVGGGIAGGVLGVQDAQKKLKQTIAPDYDENQQRAQRGAAENETFAQSKERLDTARPYIDGLRDRVAQLQGIRAKLESADGVAALNAADARIILGAPNISDDQAMAKLHGSAIERPTPAGQGPRLTA